MEHGKFRIYEQYLKKETAAENAAMLKEEYGWGGAYPALSDRKLDEAHDGKGIKISHGSLLEPDTSVLLSWKQVEKRIGELISIDRYLNPKEKEQYPQWFEAQEKRRAEMAERNANREILNTAPPEKETVQIPTTYDDIRDKLIAKGIPAEEIAYISISLLRVSRSSLHRL